LTPCEVASEARNVADVGFVFCSGPIMGTVKETYVSSIMILM
jgi:hypothetical protein